MLANVTYNNPEITRKTDALVGKPYTLRQRWDLRGIGSPRLVIRESSPEIRNLLLLDNNRDTCNIELRPGGIIVGFRSLLESYALVIPYYKLSLYKGKSREYSIYKDHFFIMVGAGNPGVHQFMSKVLNLKHELRSHFVDDL